MRRGSAGLQVTQYYHHNRPVSLESGAVLPRVDIAFETYGTLNSTKSNAILICHSLSGDSHAAGYHEGEIKQGWWDIVIGPGKAFDTEKYFIICSNVLGGCKGTTGPSSINPETEKPYGLSFPVITIQDMVDIQKILIDNLGIECLYSVAGGSMGGMQALTWCLRYSENVKKAIIIASTGYSTPQQIAFNLVGRLAITSDPGWDNGEYYNAKSYDSQGPANGLSIARMIGHITYLSDESMQTKFGRDLRQKERPGYDFSTDFEVESYLEHQGNSFIRRFDANSYLYITKAVDYFDLTEEGSLIEGLKEVKASCLVIAISSDWLYPPYQSQEIAGALSANDVEVEYCEIKSHFGHDAFLLENGQLNYLIGRFLNHILVRDVMLQEIPTINQNDDLDAAARIMIQKQVNHLPVLSSEGTICGIVTSWDIAKAVACNFSSLNDVISRNTITAVTDEPLADAARRMKEHNISALPVIEKDGVVVGLLTSDAISTLFEGKS